MEVYGGKQHNVDFGIFAVDRYHSSIEIAPTTLVADGESTATVTVTLRDNAGNPLSGRAIDILVPGTAITITTPLAPTDALGQTRGTILSTRAQQVLVSAHTISDNVTLSDAIPITFTAGLPSTERSQFEVSPTTVVANGRNSARFVLVLRDQFANPVSGKAVTVSADGTGVDVTQDSQQTDSSGAITGSIRTTQAQVVTLHAYDTTDQIIGPQAVVHFTSTDPQQSSVSVVPATLVADGSSPVTVTVTLRDQNGEALPDKPVALQVLGGETFVNGIRIDGSEVIGQSGLDGSATAILTTTLVGPRTVVAIGDNIQLNQQARVDFTVGPVDPVASQLAADKTTLVADGVASTTLTATLRDRFGHPVTDKTVRIRATGDVTLSQSGALTDSSGRVEATLRSTTVQTVTVTAVDEHDDPIVSQEVQLAFVAGPTDPAHSNVVVTPTSLLADGKQTATITATLRDTLDHPLANRNVLLIVGGSDNTIAPGVQSATDSSGTVTFHLTSTRGEQKSIAVRDLSDNVTLNGDSVTFATLPPPAAANPSPTIGAVNVPISTVLAWQAVSQATSYDLTLWRKGQVRPDTPTIRGLTSASYDPEGDLPTNTTFYWDVRANNSGGSTQGPVWSFTTEALPDLIVTDVTVPPSGFSGQSFEVRWTITNRGDRGTTVPTWYDRVYLSASSGFDVQAATYLGQKSNPAYLAPGESYVQTATWMMPQDASGNRYIFVIADGTGSLRELNETNNTVGSAAINVSLTPPPDLQVTTVTAPDTAFSGTRIPIRWQVTNIGEGPTSSVWGDQIYLSTDATFSPATDRLLASVSHNGAIAADASYVVSTTVTLPQAIFGDYTLFVVTDGTN